MKETLYKTDRPDELAAAEYYQIRIETAGPDAYFVREVHGWYDDTQRKALNHTTTLHPDEPCPSWQEALIWYDAQLKHRAAEGFCHCFWIDPENGSVQYRRVDPNSGSQTYQFIRSGKTI